MATPNRRSTGDLQRVLDGLIGNEGSIRCGDLPDVLLRYEAEHDVTILEPTEYDGLRLLCDQNPEIELEAKDIFAFLSIIPKVEPKSPPQLPHSVSMPDHDIRKLQNGASVPVNPRRRHSDRVRSPSDSSGSDSDAPDRAGVTSEGKAFPKASSVLPSDLPRPVSHRVYGLSELASRQDTPPGSRRKGSQQPPSAYSPFGAFARPSPASRRRNGSTESAPASDTYGDDSMSPRPSSQTRVRKISQPSMRASSPLWSGSQPSNPASPLYQTFASRYQSADADGSVNHLEEQDINEADLSLEIAEGDGSDASEGMDQVGDEVSRPGISRDDSLNPRLSRISTESAVSLRTSHDKLQALQKQNGELARKLKEAEKQLAVIGAENERMVEDLQERLEEAKAEIAMKRKDEKELKSKDRAQTIQISGFEADISSLQRSLEAAKANHANMSKMYNSQCDEAQRLRDLLRDRDEEIQRLEDASQVHEGDEHKFTQEITILQSEVSRLEHDLQVARQAEAHLETQKQENLQLKETIDRMRFELEEARSHNAAPSHSRGATSSGTGTLSRNLGAEITRRMIETEATAPDVVDDDDGSDESEIVETVVTTHRTRKAAARATSHGAGASRSPDSAPSATNDGRLYFDVAVSTEPEPITASPAPSQGSPPAYTAEPQLTAAEQALLAAHPRKLVGGIDARYDKVVQATGLRCTLLESELVKKQRELAVDGQDISIESLLSYMVLPPDFFSKYGYYLVAAFAMGVLLGSRLFSVPSRDAAMFQRMNTLAVASGTGEGFLPFGQRGVVGFMEKGAKMVAGRVPS